MTAEVIPDIHSIITNSVRNEAATKHSETKSIIEYPACGGRPASSPTHWVPADFIGYQMTRLLHITDEDLKKRKGS